MSQKLVLAKNTSEANRYAKTVGLERFTYRAVRNAGAIRGVRNAEVHLLSSFTKRPDRFAILDALRWAKTLEIFYIVWEDDAIQDGTEGDPRFIAGSDGTLDTKTFESFRQRHIAGVDQTDEREHVLSEDCWCEPEVVRVDGTHDFEADGSGGWTDPDFKQPELTEDDIAEEYALGPIPTDEEEHSAPSPAPESSEDPAPAEESRGRTRRRRCSTGEHLVEAADLDAHEADEHSEDVSDTRPDFDDIFGGA